MNKSVTLRGLALFLAAAVSSGAAQAGAPLPGQARATETRTHLVRFRDLDLSRIEDTAVLYSRLRRAAHIVCEPLPSNDPGDSRQYESCVDTAIAEAVLRVNRPLLSDFYAIRRNDDKRS